jgi:succinyl-diaminopimelate desuccinylase
MKEIDPVHLAATLIQCPSVTPTEGGAIQLLEMLLQQAGFACTRIERGGISNLYARFGTTGPVFGFNGHTDVVPVGDVSAWTHAPFTGTIEDGVLWGRGATDMKSGVAAFVSAAITATRSSIPGSIAIMITGDEEGPAKHGTLAILDWMQENGERIDHCLVGEPTSLEQFGDMIKVGRRGSVNFKIVAEGTQGHVAYPHRAKNPITALVELLHRLITHKFDDGTDYFDPSTLAITTIDVGNDATNVIPSQARAGFNIRFNDAHTGASLTELVKDLARAVSLRTGVFFDVQATISGESFLTKPGEFTDLLVEVLRAETGAAPELSTSGGTSDARFMARHCPVVELGLTGLTMHQVDERVPVEEIRRLREVYLKILQRYFLSPPTT